MGWPLLMSVMAWKPWVALPFTLLKWPPRNTRVPSWDTLMSMTVPLVIGRQSPGVPLLMRTLMVFGTPISFQEPHWTRLNRPAA